jgi:hypothetical protein
MTLERCWVLVAIERTNFMNTPSHWIMTIAAARFLHRRRKRIGTEAVGFRRRYPRLALAIGAWAPDTALTALTIGGLIWFQIVKGWTAGRTAEHMFKHLFYHDPGWIFLHNFLHSPTMVLLLSVANALLLSPWPQLQRWLKYFLVACLFHDLVDIVTHHDDGPLFLFPFNWHLRFASPVSYWDPAHGGRAFAMCEFVLNIALVVYLFYNREPQPASNASGLPDAEA